MPVKVGVVSFVRAPFVGVVIVTVGAAVSMRNVTAALVPVAAPLSVCDA